MKSKSFEETFDKLRYTSNYIHDLTKNLESDF